MKRKAGRPKLENPINIRTTVRLDAKSDELFNQYCKKHGISKGEAVRKSVLLLMASDQN